MQERKKRKMRRRRNLCVSVSVSLSLSIYLFMDVRREKGDVAVNRKKKAQTHLEIRNKRRWKERINKEAK